MADGISATIEAAERQVKNLRASEVMKRCVFCGENVRDKRFEYCEACRGCDWYKEIEVIEFVLDQDRGAG